MFFFLSTSKKFEEALDEANLYHIRCVYLINLTILNKIEWERERKSRHFSLYMFTRCVCFSKPFATSLVDISTHAGRVCVYYKQFITDFKHTFLWLGTFAPALCTKAAKCIRASNGCFRSILCFPVFSSFFPHSFCACLTLSLSMCVYVLLISWKTLFWLFKNCWCACVPSPLCVVWDRGGDDNVVVDEIDIAVGAG